MISKFHTQSISERRQALMEYGISPKIIHDLAGDNSEHWAELDAISENVIGAYRLPLSVLPRLLVNGRPHCIAMSTEEPSVVAAVNRVSRVFNHAGGVKTQVSRGITKAQIAVAVNRQKARDLCGILAQNKQKWIDMANNCDPILVQSGGGAYDFDVKALNIDDGSHRVIVVGRLFAYTCEAMGANAVNTMAETILNTWMAQFGHFDGLSRVMAIVSNDRQGHTTCAHMDIPESILSNYISMPSAEFIDKIILSSQFAQNDPERCATHDKGVMNGIIAAAMPLGQDTRAICAAAYSDHESPFVIWRKIYQNDQIYLSGELNMILPVGTVGGIRHISSVNAGFALDGIHSSDELCSMLGAVGLAQNFGALWALVTEGIQSGHMKLHLRKA